MDKFSLKTSRCSCLENVDRVGLHLTFFRIIPIVPSGTPSAAIRSAVRSANANSSSLTLSKSSCRAIKQRPLGSSEPVLLEAIDRAAD